MSIIHRRKINNEIFQSQSDDELHLHSNSNLNDCNLLLNNKRNPETSIFDDSSLATVSRFRINHATIISRKQVFPLAVSLIERHFVYSISQCDRGKTSVAEIFIDFSFPALEYKTMVAEYLEKW